MTAPTPTAATPEELARTAWTDILKRIEECPVGWPESGQPLADIIAAAIRQHSEAQRAEIIELTLERDEAIREIRSLTAERREMEDRAIAAEADISAAHQALTDAGCPAIDDDMRALGLDERVRMLAAERGASQERERLMREALSKPGILLFLDGRNEHGSHVTPLGMQTIDIAGADEDLAEAAEQIVKSAEDVGYPIGSAIWCDFSRFKGQYDGMGRCEIAPCIEFVSINLTMTQLFGWHAETGRAALQPQETADVR